MSANGAVLLTLVLCIGALLAPPLSAEVERRVVNDGQLILEDLPEIPQRIVDTLAPYQHVRGARVAEWTADGSGLYVYTRFADVRQLHRVDAAGGTRRQLTFFEEPPGDVARQPQGSQLLFTRDVGGNEFSQLFLMPAGRPGATRMLSDGSSRNRRPVWNRAGTGIAFQSTRRNGASNDVWFVDAERAAAARLVVAAPEGASWIPVGFSADDRQLLVRQYVGNADSRIHVVDLESGERRRVAGDPERPSSNSPIAFDSSGRGLWYTTDAGGEFEQLAWGSIDGDSPAILVTDDIPWNVEEAVFSEDRLRGAFTTNEEGYSRLYLLDPRQRRYRAVDGLPRGIVDDLRFSPDGGRLAMTLQSARTPSDVFVLTLGAEPLAHGAVERWTYSEVGGLDTAGFVEPTLVRYPTFDSDAGGPASIPAWLYKPSGDGPFPVIVQIHGGPESQSRPGFSATYQMWVDTLGAAVIRPNVRGSSGYGKTYMGLDNGMLRENSVRDIGALLDWIATRPDLDENRVAVFGGSYGGYMVLASAVHYSDRLRAAVDVVGISNFVTFLENTQDYRRDLRRAEYGDERDPAMRRHLEAISPLNKVERIAVPLFVVQGQNDPRVPVTEAEQIVAALRAQGSPVWYMNALNEGHGYRRKANRDVYQQATALFFERFLLGPGYSPGDASSDE
jgi:dipeptidyl aminopeptidase/acylaminoacyl peptidase